MTIIAERIGKRRKAMPSEQHKKAMAHIYQKPEVFQSYRVYYNEGSWYWEDNDSGHGPFDSSREAALHLADELDVEPLPF